MFNFLFGYKWRTVAIDTSNGWHRTDRKTGEETFHGDHIILFQVCDRTGARRIECEDPTEMGRKFALESHCGIALQRTKWEQMGEITGYRDKDITWVDNSYAPLRGFEDIIKNLKEDEEFAEMLKHQMIDDALGQLEVAVKLYVNNQPKVETD